MAMIDLRSDTVTHPTDEMREAMYRAEVGDSMRGEDPTVDRLEALSAEMLGKEAGLYLSSGTMGNLVALLTHTQHGDEVLFEHECHAYYYEVGGFAALGGLAARTVRGRYGVIDPDDIEEALRPDSSFFPRTRLMVIENTHNRGGGNAVTLDQMAAMTGAARKHGLMIHMDGARVFNAATALGVPASAIAAYVDTVQFCVSKGLSAPVGSMLVGTREFIERARKKRKLVGGDLRQSGIIAAAGIVALEKMVGRLGEDHHHAAMLRAGLATFLNGAVDMPPIPTNMVFVDSKPLGMTGEELAAALETRGVLANVNGTNRIRLVTHRHITAGDVETTIEALHEVARAREQLH